MIGTAELDGATARDGVLLERTTHLAALELAMTAVQARGQGCLVLVGGEAGVGKTTLVREFCDQRRRTHRVLWGACDALFTPRPLGPLLDIAHATGGRFDDVVTRAAKPHEVAAALLQELRSQGPTILVLEDVHWADEASLDVLRLLTPRMEQTCTLVVATYRDDGLDRLHPLRLVLGELRPGPMIRRLPVERLSLDSVQQLASASELDAAELYRTTAGNPFFVTEVLASPAGAMPGSIRDAVLGRAARLGDRARIVLDAVAVTPPRAELWLLTALAGEAVEAIEECLSAGMLEPAPAGLSFRHELARRAVEEALPPHRLADLHRRALAALVCPPVGEPDLARLAHHAEGAGDSGAVLRLAPAAALHAASRGGHREAAAQYARAVRFTGELPTDLRAGLLEQLSQECYLTDEMDQAVDVMEQAVACRRELGDPVRLGAALCSLAPRYWCAGDQPKSERTARDAVEVLEGAEPGRELARAYSTLSQLAMNNEDAAATVDWGTRALDLAQRLDDTEIIVHSLNNLGTVELLAGGSTAQLERSLRLAGEAGLDEHLGRAFLNLSWGITRTRSYRLASRVDEAVEACADRGLELWWLYATAFHARYDLDQGRWSVASDAAATVLRYRRGTRPLLRVLALCVTGVVRARRGDPERWAPLDEALAIAHQSNDLQWVAPVALARAETAWLDGLGRDAVLEATSHVLDLAVLRRSHWVIGELLLWRRLAGVEEPLPADLPEPFALQLNGQAVAAAELWTGLGCPYEAALALGSADDDEALRRALDELQVLGARPAAAMVSRRLRERGAGSLPRGPRASTSQNPASLTSREMDVLRFESQGLRNAQIAERMFLSEKTVGHHVSAVLRKLDVRTRGQAAAEAALLGVLDTSR